MSKITISDITINPEDESLLDEITEQVINGIVGGWSITITIVIKF